MIVLGVSGGLLHDAAAALVVDGDLVAMAEEERFLRSKRAKGEVPANAVLYCLKAAGLRLGDLDALALGWNPALSIDARYHTNFMSKLTTHEYFRGQTFPPLVPVEHHLAHAAVAFFASGLAEATVVVADGQGESSATSIFHGTSAGLARYQEWPLTESLGLMYQSATKFLGLGRGGEGKAMGLAAYAAEAQPLQVELRSDGYSFGLVAPTGDPRSWSSQIQAQWLGRLAREFGAYSETRYRYRPEEGRVTSEEDAALLLGGAKIASSVQATVEQILVHLCRSAMTSLGSRNLVLGGGVALNCSANGRVREALEPDNLYVFPASGDSGTAAGAAIMAAGMTIGGRTIRHAYFGPDFSAASMRRTLEVAGIPFREPPNIAESVAFLIEEQNTVGWFQGAAEIGPRALCHRSILARPDLPKLSARVNQIKRRETWRPLAPSGLRSCLEPLLGIELPESPFMLEAIATPSPSQLAGVVHVDGTARLQIVEADADPLVLELLAQVRQKLGVGAVLNTSFNDESEPVVLTPRDALRTFFATGLDALALGPFLVSKTYSSQCKG